MLTDAQAGWHDSTVHAQGFSHWKRGADNHDIIRWHHCHYAYVKGWSIKGECAWAFGSLIWVLGYSTFSDTLWEAITLSQGYLSASCGVRLQLYREVFFVCSSVSAQGYLEHPELVYLSYLQVNQVSHHPTSLGPGIGAAWTMIFGANWCMWDKLWLGWAYQSIQHPWEESHMGRSSEYRSS